MEIKVNKDIREYQENMYFGLSLRQFIFSVLACVAAVGSYFLLQPVIGTEAVSWVCVLVALPFALIGFVRYNGMPAEKFFAAWFKTEFLLPKKLTFRNTNIYYKMMQDAEKQRKKERRKNVKNFIKNIKRR